MSQPGAIDGLSKRIIEQLQEDGRRSYAEIGRAVGLSEAAVRQRVQRLTESGAMQVVAVTDPMQLGFHRQAMIGLRVAGDSRDVAAELEKISAVDYLVLTAGSFDILAEVVCESDDDLVELLNSRIRSLPGRHLVGDVRLPRAAQAVLRLGNALRRYFRLSAARR